MEREDICGTTMDGLDLVWVCVKKKEPHGSHYFVEESKVDEWLSKRD